MQEILLAIERNYYLFRKATAPCVFWLTALVREDC